MFRKKSELTLKTHCHNILATATLTSGWDGYVTFHCPDLQPDGLTLLYRNERCAYQRHIPIVTVCQVFENIIISPFFLIIFFSYIIIEWLQIEFTLASPPLKPPWGDGSNFDFTIDASKAQIFPSCSMKTTHRLNIDSSTVFINKGFRFISIYY